MSVEYKNEYRDIVGSAAGCARLIGATILVAGLCAISFGSSANAQSAPSFSWGTGTGSTVSAFSHLDAATLAVLAAQGRASVLPGASVISTGVLNSITVIGDNNVLTSDQQGENNGNVSSTVNVNQ
ncbi:MAG: hypothetical protein JKY10_10755 [Cohaesibacteraceae bacterium]|nr:hypothetical protein [Cohaesibacteraceae bacterium]